MYQAGTAQAYIEPTGKVSCSAMSMSYNAYRWIESAGAPVVADSLTGGVCSDGSTRVYVTSQSATGQAHLYLYAGYPDGGAVGWGMDDISWEANKSAPILSPATRPPSWTPPAAGRLTGYTPATRGNLLCFTHGEPGWGATTLTPAGGPKLIGDPSPVNIDVEHVFAVGVGGAVFDAHPGPDGGWVLEDISGTQRPPFLAAVNPAARPCVQAVPNPDGATWEVSVVFTGSNGHLVVLYNPAYNPSEPTASWTHTDLTQTASNGQPIAGNPVRDGFGALLTTAYKTGDLLRWTWNAGEWTCLDISQLAGNPGPNVPWPALLAHPPSYQGPRCRRCSVGAPTGTYCCSPVRAWGNGSTAT